MSYRDDPQVQTMIANMPEKTGRPLEAWLTLLGASDLEKHGQMIKLLKEQGVSHGFANTIAHIYRQEATGGPEPEADLVAAQFAGPKAALRPIYDALLAAVADFGADVEIAPKKSYVSLRRSKQFAIVKAATRTRVDLGLNLSDVAPTDRLTGGKVFNGMCSRLVRLTAVDDVDAELVGWLRQAYALA
jgi:predicted transport protein